MPSLPIAIDRNNAAPGALDRRPEARAFRVADLLFDVKLGRVRIPAFQRPLSWLRQDALKLVDSLYRGYPVGTLLFWETSADAGAMRFGAVAVSAGSRSDALWVVDGQQRIVSLARVLLASEADHDDFALYFDLDCSEFVRPPPMRKREEDSSRWLPLTEVLDSERLFQWLLERSSANRERRERAIQLGKRIREYEIPAYVVRTNSEEILREVFGRVNSTGKQLNASQVFDALHGARSQNRPATIPDIVHELESLDFGRVEEKILFRLLRVLQGADVIGEPLRLTPEEAATAYRQTAEAAKRAIHFFRKVAGIPNYDLLPYKQPLVTLGKFFHFHPEANARSLDLLGRWFWRGALNGAHQGSTLSTRKALAQITENEDASVQRMLTMVAGKPDRYPQMDAPFNFRHAASKLLVLALLARDPRDLESGLSLSQQVLLDFRAHEHDLPVIPVLASLSGNQHALIRSAANRLIHPARPGGLRRLLLNVADPLVLLSHGIGDRAIQALRAEQFEAFLELRAGHLQLNVDGFFEQHARWNESDRPALSALMVEDD